MCEIFENLKKPTCSVNDACNSIKNKTDACFAEVRGARCEEVPVDEGCRTDVPITVKQIPVVHLGIFPSATTSRSEPLPLGTWDLGGILGERASGRSSYEGEYDDTYENENEGTTLVAEPAQAPSTRSRSSSRSRPHYAPATQPSLLSFLSG